MAVAGGPWTVAQGQGLGRWRPGPAAGVGPHCQAKAAQCCIGHCLLECLTGLSDLAYLQNPVTHLLPDGHSQSTEHGLLAAMAIEQ